MFRIITFIICSCLIVGFTICYPDTQLASEKPTENNNISQVIDTDHRAKKYSSPQETWLHFKNALLDGNYESAIKCYYSSKRNNVNKFRKIGDFKTKQMIRQMKSLEKVNQEEDTAKYLLVRDMQGVEITTYVYFARINNEWKIDKF